MEPTTNIKKKNPLLLATDTTPSAPGDPLAKIKEHFTSMDMRASTAPEPRDQAGTYLMKLSLKQATHAQTRIEERTPFHKSNINKLQRAVDQMGLSPGDYHLPLRGKTGEILGYAAFKAVPGKKNPVLATVLAPHMSPKGQNLETVLKIARLFTTDIGVRGEQDLTAVRKHRVAGQGILGPDAVSAAFSGLDSNTGNVDDVPGEQASPGW